MTLTSLRRFIRCCDAACQNCKVNADGTNHALRAPERSGVLRGGRPSFSVVVAAHQAAHTIQGAVNSALAQTEPPHEIIVANDGSTDDTLEALSALADRVSILDLPHRGAAAASNAAVAAATGDFVVVLDADDAWHAKRLERIGDLAAARPDLDLITTDAYFVVDGQRKGTFYGHNTFPVDRQDLEILRRTFFFAHVAVRRSRWLEVGGFSEDLSRGYDWDLQLRLLHTGSVAGCVMEPLADYTIHEDSLSANRYESLQARVRLLGAARKRLELSNEQVQALEAARAEYRRRARAARAESTLMQELPGRRLAALDKAASRRVRPRERAFLVAAAVAPRWAGARLRRSAAARGRAAADRAVP
jgi:GT2 family glycosyltransferase